MSMAQNIASSDGYSRSLVVVVVVVVLPVVTVKFPPA
jgi:hypothetical protein